MPVQKLWKSNPKHAISIQNFVIGVSNALKNRKLAVYVMLGFLLEGGEKSGNFALYNSEEPTVAGRREKQCGMRNVEPTVAVRKARESNENSVGNGDSLGARKRYRPNSQTIPSKARPPVAFPKLLNSSKTRELN